MSEKYLVLENGNIFKGEAFGYEGEAVGELVFTTGMVGYTETLTDASYYGQLVMQTFPLIGNYGVNEQDFEGESRLFGYVVREYCKQPSNFRAEITLDDYLKSKKIPAICGIDTRELTRIIRINGVMNAKICNNPPTDLGEISSYKIENALSYVTNPKTVSYLPTGEEKFRVTLIDCGVKKNIIRSLYNRGCRVTCVPSFTKAEDILATEPDGIVLSNGPGDPAENTELINELKKLLGKKPIFGICLGHQLLALANGAKTTKLCYGHRGVNQPVREVLGTRTYITCQNHGYAVQANTLPDYAKETFRNANDGTNEGVVYENINAFSVQFHPEACCGPCDTSFLFDRFCERMKAKGN